MKAIKLVLSMAAVAGALTMTSCGDDSDDTPSVENTLTLCQDGIDNDGDGNIDCADSDCLVFTACDPDPDPTCTDGIQNGDETGVDCGGSCNACTEKLEGAITADMTLDASKVYIIDGFVRVNDGVTLTIPAGTILKAETGDGADASALIVTRGGKINAVGEADKPIIFTSVSDNIQPGQTASSLDVTSDAGKWGGLVILGKAPVSVKPADATDGVGKEGSIEGIPTEFEFSRYGGDVANDDSGDLKFVSIRFTGTELLPNKEIQGLTLGGVGSGTSISDIEIISSKDDGVEFFGGSVSITNILIAYQEDDGIDIDQTYSGTVDNGMVLNYNPNVKNDGFEIDGPEATDVNDSGYFTIKNTTVVQKGGANMARVKSKAQGTIENCAFKGYADAQLFNDDGAKDITVKDSEFNLPNTCIPNNGGLTVLDNMFSVSSFTKGADESKFSWTYAKELNLF